MRSTPRLARAADSNPPRFASIGRLCIGITLISVLNNSHAIELSDEHGWMQEVFSPPMLNDGWAVSDIDGAGLERQTMAELTHALAEREFNNIQAVLIEHGGALVYEYYASITPEGKKGTFHRNTLHPVYSVTKSVTSLLLGISLQSDFEEVLKRPIHSFFPERKPNRDQRTQSLTLQHILTMTAGYHWNEMDLPYTTSMSDDNVMQTQPDPVGYVLSRPLRESPGERWYYSGGMAMVVADIVDQATPRTFLEYAKEVLLTPLGISNFGWQGQWPSNTLVNASWGLHLRARDLAKLGSLVLNHGQWHDQQIVPPQWIALSTRRLREDLDSWSADGAYGYGLQWWHGNFEAHGESFEAFTALGWGGQRVFVVPEKDIAVTVFASHFEGDWLMPEKILKRIFAAKRASQPSS